jgi:hypothetical protein
MLSLTTAIIALMMEVETASEKSVNFYETTRRNTPEGCHFAFRLKSQYLETELFTIAIAFTQQRRKRESNTVSLLFCSRSETRINPSA